MAEVQQKMLDEVKIYMAIGCGIKAANELQTYFSPFRPATYTNFIGKGTRISLIQPVTTLTYDSLHLVLDGILPYIVNSEDNSKGKIREQIFSLSADATRQLIKQSFEGKNVPNQKKSLDLMNEIAVSYNQEPQLVLKLIIGFKVGTHIQKHIFDNTKYYGHHYGNLKQHIDYESIIVDLTGKIFYQELQGIDLGQFLDELTRYAYNNVDKAIDDRILASQKEAELKAAKRVLKYRNNLDIRGAGAGAVPAGYVYKNEEVNNDKDQQSAWDIVSKSSTKPVQYMNQTGRVIHKSWYHDMSTCASDYKQMASFINEDIAQDYRPLFRIYLCIFSRIRDLNERLQRGEKNEKAVNSHKHEIGKLQILADILKQIESENPKFEGIHIDYDRNLNMFTINDEPIAKRGGKRKTRKARKSSRKQTRRRR